MEAVFYLNGCRMMAVTGLRLELITSGDGWRSYGHVYIQYQHAHIYGEETRRDAVRERSWVKRTLATSLAHRKDKLQIDLRKTLSEGRGDSHRKHRERTINTREVWKLKVLFIFTAHIKGRKSDADVALAMCEGKKNDPTFLCQPFGRFHPLFTTGKGQTFEEESESEQKVPDRTVYYSTVEYSWLTVYTLYPWVTFT